MEIFSTSKNLIKVRVFDHVVGTKVDMSSFYGPLYRDEKPIFWELVQNLSHDVTQPWCCIGDFNELTCPHEKWGDADWCPSKVKFLQDFMENNSLIDVGFSRPEFSWAKKENWEVII